MRGLSLGVGLFCLIFSLIVYHFITSVHGDHHHSNSDKKKKDNDAATTEECMKSWVKKFSDEKSEKVVWSRISILVNKFDEQSEKGLFYSQGDDGKFIFSFCNDPTGGHRKKLSGGIWNKKDQILLANGEKPEVEYKGSNTTWIALHMKSGDSCKNGECNSSATNYNKATVLIVCDPTAEKAKFYQISPNVNCSHTFILSTKLMCDIGHIEKDGQGHPTKSDDHELDDDDNKHSNNDDKKKSSHFNGLAYFFFVLFLFAAAYMIIGFLYKRHVTGARGLEQIPNYLFWLRIVRNVQAFFATSSPHQRANQRYRQYDDDFRYDQPPLMADDDPTEFGGGGGASLDGGHVQQHQQQQNSAGARRLSLSSNSNSASGGGGAKDDSDVRLLVV